MQNDPGGREGGRSALAGPEFIFVNWREMLDQAALSVPQRRVQAEGIEAYLQYCRDNGISVGVATARDFLSDALRRSLTLQLDRWREGLRWYFLEGRKRGKPQPPGVPSVGQADTGKAPWESRLIERLRLKHYSWRTEQTYREWSWRLAASLSGRELASAKGEDLKQFLSEIAVRWRVSAATQRQALNALVFLFREALGRDPGDLSGYEVSRRGRRVPVVLTRQECQRLFESLEGTPRLMAELMPMSARPRFTRT